jgi:hypothetical protein
VDVVDDKKSGLSGKGGEDRLEQSRGSRAAAFARRGARVEKASDVVGGVPACPASALVEGSNERQVGDVDAALDASPHQYAAAATGSQISRLREQPRFAHAGLTSHQNEARVSLRGRVQGARKELDLPFTADERSCRIRSRHEGTIRRVCNAE